MMKYIKTCDSLASELRQGNAVDLAIIRQPPSSQPPQSEPASELRPAEPAPDNVAEEEEAPQVPATILESLKERLARYSDEERRAQEAGNGSKARRMGRIKKQYEEAPGRGCRLSLECKSNFMRLPSSEGGNSAEAIE